MDARAVIVGFGDYRAELEALAPERTLFTGPLEHRHLAHLIPLTDVTVVPSIFPEAFGMVAAEAAAAGSLPLVANHSGLAEIAAGVAEEYPEAHRDLTSFATGDAEDLAVKAPAPPFARSRRAGRAGRGRKARGSRSLELDRRLATPPEALRVTSRRGGGDANRRRAAAPRA